MDGEPNGCMVKIGSYSEVNTRAHVLVLSEKNEQEPMASWWHTGAARLLENKAKTNCLRQGACWLLHSPEKNGGADDATEHQFDV